MASEKRLLQIDGAMGEGGGQIVRSALGLSLVTGHPFFIRNIRAGRRKPGLRRQHLAAVRAATRIGQAQVEGATLGSMALCFTPGRPQPGRYRFDVGTAGSCTLVLQAVLPALLTASGPSQLLLEGGTHNPFAPPFEFLEHAFLPLIRRMGAGVQAVLERPGFFPAGGGRLKVDVEPASQWERLELLERGEVRCCRARAAVAHLPRSIAERELDMVRRMGWGEQCLEIRQVEDSQGPGNVLTVSVECEQTAEVFTGFGRRGVPAERVASSTVQEAQEYLQAGVPVGRHLADQLLIPMALAGGGRFRTLEPTRHTQTNAEVLEMFLPVEVDIQPSAAEDWCITVRRNS